MYAESVDLGTFDVVSGKLTVSDPCYEPGTWCAGELRNVLTGTWNAMAVTVDVGEWGDRISRLIVYHDDYQRSKGLRKQTAPFEVGVDSGQAGFFDSSHYQDDSIIDDRSTDYGDIWYSHCCHVTLARPKAGVIPFGVVSSSGFGDGGYSCTYYETPAGYVVKAEICFITKSELAEYD